MSGVGSSWHTESMASASKAREVPRGTSVAPASTMWVGRALTGCVRQSLGRALTALTIVGLAGACGSGASVTPASGNCAPGDMHCATCSGGGFCSPQGCPALGCPAGDGGAAADGPADDASGRGSMADAHAQAAVGDASAEEAGAVDASPSVCPGASPPPAGYPLCRSSTDCKGAGFCAPQPAFGCGACIAAPRDCLKDSDCAGAGTVCEPVGLTGVPGGCLCSPGSQAGARCMIQCPQRACDTGSQCTATGHCQPIRCDQGFTCATDRICRPGASTADPHGCAVKLCTDGLACAADQECSPTAAMADALGCAPRPCSHGYSCPTGWHCGSSAYADLHGCAPLPCSSAPCDVNETCDPTQPGRGCVARKCTRDGECDCGACVEGTCRPSLWICSSPPP